MMETAATMAATVAMMVEMVAMMVTESAADRKEMSLFISMKIKVDRDFWCICDNR